MTTTTGNTTWYYVLSWKRKHWWSIRKREMVLSPYQSTASNGSGSTFSWEQAA